MEMICKLCHQTMSLCSKEQGLYHGFGTFPVYACWNCLVPGTKKTFSRHICFVNPGNADIEESIIYPWNGDLIQVTLTSKIDFETSISLDLVEVYDEKCQGSHWNLVNDLFYDDCCPDINFFDEVKVLRWIGMVLTWT